MAKAKVPIDQFANRAIVELTMSAANTETFEQINFGVGLFQGVGLVLHRVEYVLDRASLTELVGNSDEVRLAITTRDSLTSLMPVSQDVICYWETAIHGQPAASQENYYLPFVRDFSDLPGTGLIMPANPLFFAMDTVGFVAAGYASCILYYTFKELSDKDYIELIQTLVPGNF